MTIPVQKYPVGIQDFESLRRGGYVYVDKTELVYRLANGIKYIFLARPRRFGKSLLLSTLKAYFEGKKELFDGLAITELERDWTCRPVLQLSLAAYNRNNGGNLEAILNQTFQQWEKEYNVETIDSDFSMRFRNVILAANRCSGKDVVILIDEYDAPMVAHLGDEERHSQVRNLLKSIYVNLKDMDHYIRFGMLTGVSRFSRTSIFSGLNNLTDISLNKQFSSICGITEAELKSDFEPGIRELARELEIDYDGALRELKSNYDGYHFTEKSQDIYNPFSVLNALEQKKIDSYWFNSGTPTFLVDVIYNTNHFLPEYFSEEVEGHTLSDIDTYKTDPIALMFQTGYLTIKDYDRELQTYRLGLPNLEVRRGLSKGLLQVYMNQGGDRTSSSVLAIRRAFANGRAEDAMERIKSFLAGIPYELAKGKDEIYFENNLYLLFNLIGINTYAEYHTSRGRIDLLVTMPKYIYVMELKLDGTPREALDQIDAKGYAEQFASDPRRVVKIGINFSRTTRNIDSWIIEE